MNNDQSKTIGVMVDLYVCICVLESACVPSTTVCVTVIIIIDCTVPLCLLEKFAQIPVAGSRTPGSPTNSFQTRVTKRKFRVSEARRI